MLKPFSLFFFCVCIYLKPLCQLSTYKDTVRSKELPEVILKAYEQNKRQVDLPASVIIIDKELLNRYSNQSIINALNATSGIRMEERSPGSYRLNIRGSSLRSPFGIRNVKVYFNNIPFTDPGGNTYLNHLGFYNFNLVEVIKGPGSSLYGAGTGGVMLIEGNRALKERGVEVASSLGSYGLQNFNVNINTGNDSFRNNVNYQHQESNGYRDHSALKRNILSWETTAELNKTERITGTFLYGDLYYQTPGALTKTEFDRNPKISRPGTAISPGAKEAQAAIFQKMFLAGITYQKKLGNAWSNSTSAYGAFNQLLNPAIRNYARNNQPHYGGRTIFQFKKAKENSVLTLHLGGELQQGFTNTKVYKNKNGIADSIQTDNDIKTTSYFIFSQATYDVMNWSIVAGASLNNLNFKYSFSYPYNPNTYEILLKNVVSPRIAILRKITPDVSAFLSYSKGFSPPTTEEIFPSGSIANPQLSPEKGSNYEAGIKGSYFKNTLRINITGFYFKLNNSIVQRRDALGGDYYLNAGSTQQKGIETSIYYKLIENPRKTALNLWLNHTHYAFSYKSFKQLENDFSGKRLPGVPKNNLSAGIDLLSTFGGYSNITYQYNSRTPLNDANTAFSQPFHLLTWRLGYELKIKRLKFNHFVGVDNILNNRYSLGNDINGFGGRYFNVAPGRNFTLGLSIAFRELK